MGESRLESVWQPEKDRVAKEVSGEPGILARVLALRLSQEDKRHPDFWGWAIGLCLRDQSVISCYAEDGLYLFTNDKVGRDTQGYYFKTLCGDP